jgi:hypothetical protein
MNDFYNKKAAIPREARNAANLKEALSAWVEKRLLHVVKSNKEASDNFRIEFSLVHQRYAKMVMLVTEMVSDDLISLASTKILVIMEEDFRSSTTPPQREAAGLCGAELSKIISQFTNEEENK